MGFVDDMINPDNPNYTSGHKVIVISSFVSLFLIIILATIAVTYYTSKVSQLNIDSNSEDRLTQLNEAMISILGSRWPIVLLVFILVVVILLIFLYISSTREELDINMSDSHAHAFNLIFVIFVAVLFIAVTLLAIKAYRDYENKLQTGNIPNYQPSIDYSTRSKKILELVAVLLVLVVLLVLSVWYFFFRK